MKNLYLLPTDQQSRLWINNLLQGKLELHEETLIGSNTAQHIYITSNNGDSVSDEGVHHNYGSWVLDINNEKVFKTCVNIISGDDIQKIILTTDPTLIADGVQSIDDEFLEWFVKNPSCEFIEIKKQYITPLGDIVDTCYDNERLNYKIIIPQEEPKQETLEEAAERYESDRDSFEAGAKWQAERMYNEEEVKTLIDFIKDCASNWDCDEDSHRYNTPCRMCEAQKVLEQFKKK